MGAFKRFKFKPFYRIKMVRSKWEQRYFLVKRYSNLAELEIALGELTKDKTTGLELSVFGKLTKDCFLEHEEAIKAKIELQDFLKRVLEPQIDVAFFRNDEIGTLFIAGFLVPQFLQDMNGKALGSLPSGPYGILRGLGITETDAAEQMMDLKAMCILLIFRGYDNELKKIEASI